MNVKNPPNELPSNVILSATIVTVILVLFDYYLTQQVNTTDKHKLDQSTNWSQQLSGGFQP